MGAWGELSYENDTTLDYKYDICCKLGINSADLESEDFSVIETKQQKQAFIKLLPSLIKEAEAEGSSTHIAHCIALFIVDNSIKVSEEHKNKLISIIENEDCTTWLAPQQRKRVIAEVVGWLK